MMRFLVSILLLISYFSLGQNLVINPSVDDEDILEKGSINTESNWDSPNYSSPDHYSVKKDFGYGIAPITAVGYQNPKHGQSFKGVILTYNNTKTRRLKIYREFIQGELKKTLVKGKKYFVQFFISLADFSPIVCNSIGLGFRKKNDENIWFRGRFSRKHIVQNSKDRMLSNTLHWVEIEGVYTATGKEDFLSIGNFNNFLRTKCKFQKFDDSKQNQSYSGKREPIHGSYMFIDDISVIEIPENYFGTRNESTIFVDTVLSNTPEFGSSFILQDCHFINGKSNLSPQSLIKLEKMTSYLMTNPFLTFKLNLVNETNLSIGKAEYWHNKRAEVIYHYLGSLGISLNRIIIEKTIKTGAAEEKNFIEFSFVENKIERITNS